MFVKEYSGALLWISASIFVLLLVLAWMFVREGSGNGQVAAAAGVNGERAELEIEDLTIGTGQTAQSGQTLAVHYIGTLDDGTVFDSSRNRSLPFSFTLGSGQVIPGWELGIVGMKEGGVRTLIIPPELAYGSEGIGSIPPNATLHFEVELI